MAIHEHPTELTLEVIAEYLLTAKVCLEHRKPDGGCLGYSATLLLFCVMDALGGYLAHDKSSGITQSERFMVLKHHYFGTSLTTEQIKRLEWWYRNGLAHNAYLPPGTCLTVQEGNPFDFAANGEPVIIRVGSLHQLVQQAWDRFDKSLIGRQSPLHPRKMPTSGYEMADVIGSPGASTGCPMPRIPKL